MYGAICARNKKISDILIHLGSDTVKVETVTGDLFRIEVGSARSSEILTALLRLPDSHEQNQDGSYIIEFPAAFSFDEWFDAVVLSPPARRSKRRHISKKGMVVASSESRGGSHSSDRQILGKQTWKEFQDEAVGYVATR